MSVIAQLLSPADICLDLDAPSKRRLLEEVGRLFARRHGLPQAVVVESLAKREEIGSTGLGQGVALPHARMANLAAPLAVYVRPDLPIDFGAPDGKPVTDILVVLVPTQAPEQHLHILAEAAQMFSDRRFREELRNCADADQVYRLFADWPQSS